MSCCIDFLPDPCHDGGVLTNVAAIAFDGVTPFELGLLCESFGMDRSDDGVPLLDFAVCGPHVGTFRTTCGFGVTVEHDLSRVAEADLVAVPAGNPAPEHLGPVVEAVRAAYERGARIMSVCSGAFILGEAGLLDGRECTTHWKYTDELARRFPAARVVPEVLYVDADPIITSAGTAAGLDAALHLWRKEYGAAAAAKVARRMVVPPQREGGQAQYISSPVVDCEAETLGPLLEALLIGDHHQGHPLADRAGVGASAHPACVGDLGTGGGDARGPEQDAQLGARLDIERRPHVAQRRQHHLRLLLGKAVLEQQLLGHVGLHVAEAVVAGEVVPREFDLGEDA